MTCRSEAARLPRKALASGSGVPVVLALDLGMRTGWALARRVGNA